MEYEHDNVGAVLEDRLSSLPNELIHKILSYFDMKFAVQMCMLSTRWKLVWTSMPCLNFSSGQFHGDLCKFFEFVTNVLYHRKHQIQVYSMKLHFKREASHVLVRKIANYAFSHNVQELTIIGWPENHHEFPPCLFSSHSLKHFTFSTCPFSPCSTPTTPWDFPSLTTLHLSHIILCHKNTKESLDLFSKCVNLKNLTLKYFNVTGVEVFDIVMPRLSNLMLINGYSSKVVNVIAPQLKNLTITNTSMEYMNAPPGVSSLCYNGSPPMQLCKDRFHSLNEVNICLSYGCYGYEKKDARKTINILQELHSAKYLTLSVDVVECISSFPDLLSHHPSPFSNLICLSIDSNKRRKAYKVKMCTEARNFLFENSPNAKFTMELPEEPYPGSPIYGLSFRYNARKYTFTASTANAAIVDDCGSNNNNKKDKRKEIQRKKKKLSPLNAIMVIQMTFRAYLMRRSQALRALRELAVEKGELIELWGV